MAPFLGDLYFFSGGILPPPLFFKKVGSRATTIERLPLSDGRTYQARSGLYGEIS